MLKKMSRAVLLEGTGGRVRLFYRSLFKIKCAMIDQSLVENSS